MWLKQLLLAVFIVFLIQTLSCHACWEEERLALSKLQAIFNVSEDALYNVPVQHNNGLSSEKSTNCCDWKRIKCDSRTGRVTQLELNNSITFCAQNRYINASLFLPFKQLNSLDLSGNCIKGCLHNEGFEKLEKLSDLEILNLDSNLFNNSILSSLAAISSLKSLIMSSNALEGSIYPEELNNFKNLKKLDMGHNDIEELVSSTGAKMRLSNLETLILSHNQLKNNVFSSLEELSNLKNLYLDANPLRGSFDRTKLEALKNLRTLVLDEMPEMAIDVTNLLLSLQALPYLKTLSLQTCNLTGTTFDHQKTYGFSNLETLYIDSSFIDENFLLNLGALPSLNDFSFDWDINDDPSWSPNLTTIMFETIGRMTSLQYLTLSGLGFAGTLSAFPGLCNQRQLKLINLKKNSLSGTLPLCLANLTSLQYLDFSSNLLTGDLSSSPLDLLTSIQDLILTDNNFRIPISLLPFYNFSKLSHLEILGNELYAETESHDLTPKFQLKKISLACDGCDAIYPKFLYHQQNLEDLDLSKCKMKGEFPYWLLENNTKLQTLDLSNNSLSGSIQLPNRSHVNLKFLDISYNFIHGQIPTDFGSYIPSLDYLSLSNNNLKGSIPFSLGNLSLLDSLDLSNNQLSGALPQLSKILARLYLGGNQFTGTFPISLYNCSSLEKLDLSSNQFFGEIPSWLGRIGSLSFLDLSRNNISGNLPKFEGASSLEEAYFANNKLHGYFADAFSESYGLKILDLSYNFFTGTLRKLHEKFCCLNFLLLSHNNLDGEIPLHVCMMEQFSLIDLSNNNFSGHIPHCLKASSSDDRRRKIGYVPDPTKPVKFTAKYFSYSYQGQILALFSGIDLSCNKLTGKIPTQLGNLTNIQVLNLSHNRLSGVIPSTFANLVDIESLDLSHNDLEGEIPPQLTQLNFISCFSVAYNNLSGNTPNMVKQFATFDNTSYEGNPFLCGKPLSRSCENAIPPPPSQGHTTDDEDDGSFVDKGVFYISFAGSYVTILLGIIAILCINPHWRRAWFYFLEVKMSDCYYSIVDNFHRLCRFRA